MVVLQVTHWFCCKLHFGCAAGYTLVRLRVTFLVVLQVTLWLCCRLHFGDAAGYTLAVLHFTLWLCCILHFGCAAGYTLVALLVTHWLCCILHIGCAAGYTLVALQVTLWLCCILHFGCAAGCTSTEKEAKSKQSKKISANLERRQSLKPIRRQFHSFVPAVSLAEPQSPRVNHLQPQTTFFYLQK